MQDRRELFDRWAADYDKSVAVSGEFPFDGYSTVLDTIVGRAEPTPGMSILDLGVGTGNLGARFLDMGCEVLGVDFSDAMLARVRERFPAMHTVQADLLATWPAEMSRRFDRVVSGYLLHEFDLQKKIEIIDRARNVCLADGGTIVIGDIAWATVAQREEARRTLGDRWDATEHYWAADETERAIAGTGLELAYRQVSRCAGVFVFSAQ